MSRKKSDKRGPVKEPAEPATQGPARPTGRRRWLLRLAALPVAGLAALLWATRQQPQAGILIENQSGEVIPSLRVTVAGRTTSFPNMPPGARATAPFGTSGDLFVFDGELKGRKIHGQGKAAEGLSVVIQPGGNIKFQPAAP